MKDDRRGCANAASASGRTDSARKHRHDIGPRRLAVVSTTPCFITALLTIIIFSV